jgi:hypothetical protein
VEWSNVYHAEAKGAGSEDIRHGVRRRFAFSCFAGDCGYEVVLHCQILLFWVTVR